MEQLSLFEADNKSIWQPRSYWSEMGEQDLESYVDRIFAHYRSNGYPHQDHRKSAASVFASLCSSAGRLAAVCGNGDLRFHMHALGLCWSYQRHAVEVRCNGNKSVMDAFMDDDLLRKTIRKCLKRSESMSDNHFRETIRNMAGVQKPSNFRPMAAASIYSTIASAAGRSIRVWDMCGGYGGRMLGAAASRSVSSYKCNEPCTATRCGLVEMKKSIACECGWLHLEIDESPAEDAAVGDWDVCFTSPPYWDTERYSEEPTQSCVRYKTYPEWLSMFLEKVIGIAVAGLRPDGLLVLNVAATKRCPTLPEDTVALAAASGVSLVCVWNYLLGATTKGGVKSEPVFVFAKQQAEWHRSLPTYTTELNPDYARIAERRVEVVA